MCFKSGNYNPNVFIWTSVGMIIFLLTLHYNMVTVNAANSDQNWTDIELDFSSHLDIYGYFTSWCNSAKLITTSKHFLSSFGFQNGNVVG